MNLKVDFHTHSTASDGKKSPRDLIKEAKKENVSIMALTDHDTVSGLEDAIDEGNKLGIKVIPGIELSAIHKDESIHLLGYFKKDGYKDEDLIRFLKDKEEARINRGKKIVENLKTYFNIDINYETVLKNSNGVVARPHIAQGIIDSGYDYSWNYIFENFLSDKSPAYVHNKKVSVKEGISLLHHHGAIVSLAHPVLIKKNSVEELLKSFDFDAIEAFYYLNTRKSEELFISLAHRYNKLISCGSDYHGIHNDGKHGVIGKVRFCDNYLNNFLNTLI